MAQLSPGTRENREPDLALLRRWYAPLIALVNLALLVQVLHRYHHALTPINHGLARILATAFAVNIATALAILWLATMRCWRIRLSSVLKLDVALSLIPFVMAALQDGNKGRIFHLFALVYVIFLLAKMGEFLFYAAQNGTVPEIACACRRLSLRRRSSSMADWRRGWRSRVRPRATRRTS